MSAMSELHQVKHELYHLVNYCIDCQLPSCNDSCAIGLQMELDSIVLEAFELGRDYYDEKDQDESIQVPCRQTA